MSCLTAENEQWKKRQELKAGVKAKDKSRWVDLLYICNNTPSGSVQSESRGSNGAERVSQI